MVNVLSHDGIFMNGFQAKALPIPTDSVPWGGHMAAGAGDRTGGCTGLGTLQGSRVSRESLALLGLSSGEDGQTNDGWARQSLVSMICKLLHGE